MEESDSSQPPKRCPCGFWGSPQTSGLCSKCFKANVQETTQEGLDAKSELFRNRQSVYASHDIVGIPSSSLLFTARNQATNTVLEQAEELLRQAVNNSNVEAIKSPKLDTVPECSIEVSKSSIVEVMDKLDSKSATIDIINACPEKVNVVSERCYTSTSVLEMKDDLKCNSESCDSNMSYGDNSNFVQEPLSEMESPEKRGIKRDNSVLDCANCESTPEKKVAKSTVRCCQCKCKLELAQRTIGKCKCDNVYCSLHRLPELHNCDFDHKEEGRREAREKMVKPTRHLGTSFKRLSSDS